MSTRRNSTEDVLADNLLVVHYDPTKEVRLLTDASRLHGTGYAFMQEGKLIRCGSHSLSPTESRYSTVELELFALVQGVKKCRYYLVGRDFVAVTDHRPLVGLFAKPLADITNPRLQRLRHQVAGYRFDVQWLPGKDNVIADALSRAPVFPPDVTEVEDRTEEDNYVNKTTVEKDMQLQPLLQAARCDEAYVALLDALENGKDIKDLPPSHPAKAYKSVWTELSVVGENTNRLLVYDGHRIVVPLAYRQEILRRLHLSHAGIAKTRKQAQELYYWPGITNEIKALVEGCQACMKYSASLPTDGQEEETASVEPLEPMEAVATDLFEWAGAHYIVLVDRFSGFIWCQKLKRLDTRAVLDMINTVFLEHGFPCAIRSDGGPQFRSEFNSYCELNGITHELSAPYHPQSNGLAENAVKTAKDLLKKTQEAGESFVDALAAWRWTPRADGASPAHMFFGRRPRGPLPRLPELPTIDLQAVRAKRVNTKQQEQREQQEQQQPRRRRKPLQVGDLSGSFLVEIHSTGRLQLRPRKLLRRLPGLTADVAVGDDENEDEVELDDDAAVADEFDDEKAVEGSIPPAWLPSRRKRSS